MTLRVLHVVESYGGGVSAAINSYIDATPGIEHHAVLRLRDADYRPSGELARFATVHKLAGGLAAPISVRRAISATKPQVIHAHSSFGGFFARTAVRARPGLRVVYTPHCFAFERQDISPKARAAYRFVEGALARFNTDIIAACSEREASLATALAPGTPTVYVPNVVPSDAMTISTSARGRNERLIRVGRLGPQKDPLFFRDVVRAVRRHRRVEAVWVGDGDGELRRALEADAIEVTGWLPRGEVYERIARGGVYVHTALWEGFPMAILEAHHFGLPIAGRAAGPLQSYSRDIVGDHAEDVAHVAFEALADAERAQRNRGAWERMLVESTREAQARRLIATYTSRHVLTDAGYAA